MPRAARMVVRLYAAVLADEGAKLRLPGVRVVAGGDLAALISAAPPRRDDGTTAALRHGRVVARALARCSAVVPFRMGIELGSEAEVADLLRLNAAELAGRLRRFRGCVEMGLRARVAAPPGDALLRLPFGIDRVRALAPRAEDRSERLARDRQGTTFDGCYLISRWAVDEFWRAVDGIRCAVPEVPLLASGPWAPYGFCDAPLRRAAAETQMALWSR